MKSERRLGLDVAPEHQKRARELADKIDHHRALYYAGKPEISDAAFDAIEDELRAIDPTNPVLANVGSSVVATEWEKARHEIPMGSLNKVVNEEELREWAARCEELLEKAAVHIAQRHSLPSSRSDGQGKVGHDLFVAEKLDGISIEVIYRDGKFADAITRGDGEWGERITSNVARMKGVPARIADKRSLSVRGEIILRLSDRAEHFPDIMSPRNAAAGTSKRLDGQGCEHLTVLFYDLADALDFPTEQEKFDYLKKLKLATPRFAHGSIDDVLALYKKYSDEIRGKLDYEIDGLVVYVNSIPASQTLGELNRRPRGAVAFKFASPAKITTVKDIVWDTGPSGRVTPVAIVAPVALAGANVQRASLHNAANVRALGIAVGDEVLVSRRNDVIPYVEEVVEKRGTPAEPPTACPVCGAPIFVEGEYLVCRNYGGCRALIEGRIMNWINAVGALEWGDKLVTQLVDAELVKEPKDLYALQVDDIAKLDRRGEKSAKKSLDQLKSKLPLTLPVFIAALGMEGFALQTARLLVAAGFDTIDKMLAANEDEIAAVPGLGAIKAKNIKRGLEQRREEIGRLLEAGIVPVAPSEQGPLAGLTFCFTGASEKPRNVLTKMVEDAGGRVLSGVTKELKYLVIADPASTSSKAQKARSYGTKLIDEAELEKMIAGGA